MALPLRRGGRVDTDPVVIEHLIRVVDVLRAETPPGLPDEVLAKRLDLLDVLEQYAWAGEHPRHHGPAPAGARRVVPPRHFDGGRAERPRFIDAGGAHCAVGYLIAVDDPALALAVDAADPFGFVLEMELPELRVWADAHGFTLEELAWIQPNYEVGAPACADLTDTPPVPLPDAPCEGVHLEIVTFPWFDVCMTGCFDERLVLWVSNTGTEPSPVAALRSLDGETSREVPALPPGASARLEGSVRELNAGVRVEVEGDCAAPTDVYLESGSTGGWAILDRDEDGLASVACGGIDCDDRVAGDPVPSCLAEGGANPETCEASCAVYRCMQNLRVEEGMVAPDPAVLSRCLAGGPPEGLPEGEVRGCGCDANPRGRSPMLLMVAWLWGVRGRRSPRAG